MFQSTFFLEHKKAMNCRVMCIPNHGVGLNHTLLVLFLDTTFTEHLNNIITDGVVLLYFGWAHMSLTYTMVTSKALASIQILP
jgi:hypothetical protein